MVCDAGGGVLLVLRVVPLEYRRGGGQAGRLSKITVVSVAAMLESSSVVPPVLLSVVATMTSGSSGQCN